MTKFNYGKVVSFTNITTQDFTHSYDGSPFTIKAGETVMFPFELADHLATHLARKILLLKDSGSKIYDPKDVTGGLGSPIWNSGDENQFKVKILGSVIEQEETPVNELEVLKEKMKMLEDKFLTPKETSVDDDKVPGFSLDSLKRREIVEALDTKGVKYDPNLNKGELLKILKDASE